MELKNGGRSVWIKLYTTIKINFKYIFSVKQFYSPLSFKIYSVYALFFVMNRETDTGKEFEKKLSEMAGVHPDNHTVYTR